MLPEAQYCEEQLSDEKFYWVTFSPTLPTLSYYSNSKAPHVPAVGSYDMFTEMLMD